MTTALILALCSAAIGAVGVAAAIRSRDALLTAAAVASVLLCLWVAGMAQGWW